MRVICEKEKILRGINSVINGVATKTTMPILEGILLQTNVNELKLTSYDLEIGIEYIVEAKVEEQGNTVVNATMFSEIIRRLPSSDIKITVNDKDAIKAKNIANVTANYFASEVVDLYNLNNVNILDKAIESEKPYNINVIKQLVIYFMIGFVLGAGILFIIFYFDRTIKSVEQVEQKIKLPILGSVQMMTGKGGK